MKIKHVTVTPIAIKDPPLLNASGIHEPFALRSILEIETDNGVVGLGESYGDAPVLATLQLDPIDGSPLVAQGSVNGNGTATVVAESPTPGPFERSVMRSVSRTLWSVMRTPIPRSFK